MIIQEYWKPLKRLPVVVILSQLTPINRGAVLRVVEFSTLIYQGNKGHLIYKIITALAVLNKFDAIALLINHGKRPKIAITKERRPMSCRKVKRRFITNILDERPPERRPMSCRKVKRLLSIYIDGELEKSGGQEVENHLSACVSCAGELESLTEQSSYLRQLFASIKAPALSPGFAREFYEQLEEKSHWWEIDWWIPYQRPILTGVAMACLLLALLFYPRGDKIKVADDEGLPFIVREVVFEAGRLSEQEILTSQAEDIVNRLL